MTVLFELSYLSICSCTVAEHDQIVVPKQTTGAEREARVGNHVRPNRSELTEALDDELPK